MLCDFVRDSKTVPIFLYVLVVCVFKYQNTTLKSELERDGDKFRGFDAHLQHVEILSNMNIEVLRREYRSDPSGNVENV